MKNNLDPKPTTDNDSSIHTEWDNETECAEGKK